MYLRYIRVQNICFGTFVKIALINNYDIYIFAHVSAILNLCKFDHHPMERCVSDSKRAFENIKKYH